MSDQTPNLSLPFILPAQAQKHVTHNEAIELLDLLVQLTLVSISQASPPPDPSEGQAWAVPAGALGDWAAQAGMIATWRGGGWLFVVPRDGWRAWVGDAAALHVYADGVWQPKGVAPTFQNLPQIGINASADATNRLTLRAAAALFDHDGAGHQIKINKATAADTAALLLQSGYSGRAEIGLAGGDDLTVKISSDGAAWVTAITVALDGAVQIGQALRLAPSGAPTSPQAGELYFDSATAKLRAYDGAIWHDLF